MMINLGIFRVKFWTRVACFNENHRSESPFQDKTIADFVEIKEAERSCKVLER
jgi:hypothetical protein